MRAKAIALAALAASLVLVGAATAQPDDREKNAEEREDTSENADERDDESEHADERDDRSENAHENAAA